MVQQSMSLKVLILPLSLAVAVVVAIFFIKPAFSEMTTTKKMLDEKNSQLTNLKNQNSKLQGMKSKWESLAEEKNLVSTAIPDAENVDSYVSELTSKASRSGILLSNIKMGQKSTAATGPSPTYVCGSAVDGSAASPVAPVAASPGASGAADSQAGCLMPVGVSLTAMGSWEQVLDFFKYIEDMNRISNIEAVSLTAGSQSQGQASSDLLTAEITATAFFKAKNSSGNTLLAENLVSQGNFNQKSLEKLKQTIYSQYDVPAVAPSGERNIFK